MFSDRFIYTVTGAMALLMVCACVLFLGRADLPSADVIAKQDAQTPTINVADFSTGDVEILNLNGLAIVVWRRSEEDMALAAEQNDPSEWMHSTSQILGRADRVYASDANLALENEWFFAVAYDAKRRGYNRAVITRSGDFGGLLEPHYITHFDLSGRARTGYPSDNLTVVTGEFSEDRATIQLDLRR